ncbi:MAG: hypothetical protein AAF090_01445 [Bacteroidota bacterium]
MTQNLKDLFEKERAKNNKETPLSSGHEQRFFDKLETALPKQEKRKVPVWSIAAAIAVLVASGLYYVLKDTNNALPQNNATIVEVEKDTPKTETFSLGDLSPDLKKIEDFYHANITLELSRLEIDDENKVLVDGVMEQLAELNTEYNTLTEELNVVGPNDDTISALINNLQLRLQLLQKLKSKLNQLKSSQNEQESNIM